MLSPCFELAETYPDTGDIWICFGSRAVAQAKVFAGPVLAVHKNGVSFHPDFGEASDVGSIRVLGLGHLAVC